MIKDADWRVTDLLPLFVLAQVVLLGLKLARLIAWPWWLVFAPVWGFPALILLLGIALALSLWLHDRHL